jgi:hypothetical protein
MPTTCSILVELQKIEHGPWSMVRQFKWVDSCLYNVIFLPAASAGGKESAGMIISRKEVCSKSEI